MSASFVSAVLSFPGINNPVSAIVTRTNGTRPGIALVTAVPQNDSPDTSGTATFVFGTSSNAMTWSNALCDLGTIMTTEAGQVERFVIFDRRWRWRKGAPVTGAYNVRNPDGTVIAATQKTLAQLATILFTAVGEGSADVSLITSTEYPMVVWDYDNPADELADLLETRGYVISMQADDTVKVFPVGTGATLPANDDVVTITITIDPPEVPAQIRAVCEHTLVQSMLKCVAVGEDTDGKIKLIKDLSYNPGGVGNASGWDGMDLISFAYITDPVKRDLAIKTVGRYFQVTSQADGSQNLSFGGVNYLSGGGGGGEIIVSDASQFLPLKPFLLTAAVDQFSKQRYDQAFVSGTFYGELQSNPKLLGNTSPFTRVDKREWTMNGDFGLVIFHEPATKDNGSGVQVMADVYVTCTYMVNDATTGVKDRLARDKSLGGYGTDVYKLTELQRTLTAAYTPGSSTLSGLTDTKPTVNTAADNFLNTAALNYITSVANVLLYRDCYAFSTDGVNLQIQWHVAAAGPVPFSTNVAQYAEVLPLIPTQAERGAVRATRRIQSPTIRRNKEWLQTNFGAQAAGGQGIGN